MWGTNTHPKPCLGLLPDGHALWCRHTLHIIAQEPWSTFPQLHARPTSITFYPLWQCKMERKLKNENESMAGGGGIGKKLTNRNESVPGELGAIHCGDLLRTLATKAQCVHAGWTVGEGRL